MLVMELRVFLLVCVCCAVQSAKKLDVEKQIEKLSEANIKFSINLYKELIKDEQVNNVLFSPISISAGMAMAHFGAKGNTAKQIDDTFMFNNIEDGKFHSAFGELHGLMFEKKSENVTLKSSNRVFAGQNIGLLKDYETALTVYGAKVDKLDFSDSATAVSTINKWVEETTEGKIREIVSGDDISANIKMILANTVFFKGDWHSKFVESQTEKRAFYVDHYKVVETPFMFQRGKFRYTYIEDLTLQIVELQYSGKDFNMIIMLPDNFDLAAVERDISYENVTDWLSKLEYTNLDLTLPKFKLEESLDLHTILPKMGVTDVFDAAKCDLSGISESKDLHVDQVVHKAVLEVDEKGSVAAAVTSVRVVMRSLNVMPSFTANHPFMWAIMHAPTSHILFMGRFSMPSGKVEEKGGTVEAERAEVKRSKNIVVVYADHPFIILVQSKASKAFHLMGAFKRPWGRIRSHDEL